MFETLKSTKESRTGPKTVSTLLALAVGAVGVAELSKSKPIGSRHGKASAERSAPAPITEPYSLPVELSSISFFAASAQNQRINLERTATDRPDDTNKPQVHFVVVLPKDNPDHHLDTNGQLDQSISSMQDWLLSSGGQKLTIDTYQAIPDISFIDLDEPLSSFESSVSLLRKLTSVTLKSDRFQKKRQFIIDGDQIDYPCGIVDIPGLRNSLVYSSCGEGRWILGSPTFSGIEEAMTHEIFHSLGAVCDGAPDASNFHINDDVHDLMSYAPYHPVMLDPRRNHYYNLGGGAILGCGNDPTTNLANSPFFDNNNYKSLSMKIIGEGTVTPSKEPLLCESPEGICNPCEGMCQGWVWNKSEEYIKARPSGGYRFDSWSGDCSGTENCQVIMDTDRSVVAKFSKIPMRRLRVRVNGPGAVRQPKELDCQPINQPTKICDYQLADGESTILKAIPKRGNEFVGWTGKICKGVLKVCKVTPHSNVSVGANFKRKTARPKAIAN